MNAAWQHFTRLVPGEQAAWFLDALENPTVKLEPGRLYPTQDVLGCYLGVLLSSDNLSLDLRVRILYAAFTHRHDMAVMWLSIYGRYTTMNPCITHTLIRAAMDIQIVSTGHAWAKLIDLEHVPDDEVTSVKHEPVYTNDHFTWPEFCVYIYYVALQHTASLVHLVCEADGLNELGLLPEIRLAQMHQYSFENHQSLLAHCITTGLGVLATHSDTHPVPHLVFHYVASIICGLYTRGMINNSHTRSAVVNYVATTKVALAWLCRLFDHGTPFSSGGLTDPLIVFYGAVLRAIGMQGLQNTDTCMVMLTTFVNHIHTCDCEQAKGAALEMFIEIIVSVNDTLLKRYDMDMVCKLVTIICASITYLLEKDDDGVYVYACPERHGRMRLLTLVLVLLYGANQTRLLREYDLIDAIACSVITTALHTNSNNLQTLIRSICTTNLLQQPQFAVAAHRNFGEEDLRKMRTKIRCIVNVECNVQLGKLFNNIRGLARVPDAYPTDPILLGTPIMHFGVINTVSIADLTKRFDLDPTELASAISSGANAPPAMVRLQAALDLFRASRGIVVDLVPIMRHLRSMGRNPFTREELDIPAFVTLMRSRWAVDIIEDEIRKAQEIFKPHFECVWLPWIATE